MMELKHHFTVPGSLAETWTAFNQLEDIAPCFPGAVLTGVDGDTFTGTVKVKLGPIAMLYAGTGEFLSRDEATHTVVISASGKDKRGNGTAGATVTAVLEADGTGTAVSVTTDMNVTGKPAQFGRGVIQDISDKLLEQFVQCVIKKVAAPVVESPVVEPAEPAESPEYEPPEPQGPGIRQTQPPATELDLGSAVLPVLARRFGPAIMGALAVVVLVAWLRWRRWAS
ncbi:MAG: SRPBCC family protein [Specibacter sp.]